MSRRPEHAKLGALLRLWRRAAGGEVRRNAWSKAAVVGAEVEVGGERWPRELVLLLEVGPVRAVLDSFILLPPFVMIIPPEAAAA